MTKICNIGVVSLRSPDLVAEFKAQGGEENEEHDSHDDDDQMDTGNSVVLPQDTLPSRRTPQETIPSRRIPESQAPHKDEQEDEIIVSPDTVNLSQHRYIFMRWKELFFVSPKGECGLTIAGFYYVCLDRHTGAILGFYHDPDCAPFQQLQLQAVSTHTGFTHADYDFN